MTDTYSGGKPMGVNVRKLMHMAIARLAVGDGQGVQAAIDLFVIPGKLQTLTRQALDFVDKSLAEVRATGDSRTDEEIAYQIIRAIETRRDTK